MSVSYTHLTQAHVVGDGRAFLADLFGQGVLREVALVDQALHAECDFDGVEVLTLDVLDQSHGMQVLVVHLAHIGGQGLQVGALRSPPAPFAADEDVFPVVAPPDGYGLDHPERADRVGQLVERLLVEAAARLRWVGHDIR